MMFKLTTFFSFTFLITSVACDQFSTIYNEFVDEIINPNELFSRIRSSLGDSEEANDAAKKMFDASTKIPNGVLAGNFFDLGNFDECYGITHGQIYGKYCLGTLPVESVPQKYSNIFTHNMTQQTKPRLAGLGESYAGFHFAACVPSNWSAIDIPGLLTYTEDFCYSKATKPELSTGAVVVIVVFALFLTLIVASTLFDIVLHYAKWKNPHELFVAFSFLSNGRKIFRSTKNPDQLLCLNGIKAISMMWVVIGHEYSDIMNAPLSNYFDMQKWQENPGNMFVAGATASVDTFLLVGGLVTVYTYLKATSKGVKFNLFLFYLHRYLRLTPALAVMSLIHLYLINHFGNGPLWKIIDLTLVQPCREAWWSTFLYITNYVQRGDCLPQSWYLSIDMQLFILSPIVLIPLSKTPKIGLGMLGVMTIAGVITPFVVGYVEHIGSMFTDTNFAPLYYTQTYTRFGPYVIGMVLGYFIHKIKQSGLKLQPLTVCLLWLVCMAGLVACVFAGHSLLISQEEDRWGNALYLAFNRQSWAVALSGVILLCVAGYGGPVDAFLSLPVFQFLTKLSYSMYLVHVSVIVVRHAAMKNTFKFSDIAVMHSFWGDFTFTLVMALILCLSFESPVIILEKYLFTLCKRPKQKQVKTFEV